MSRHSNSDLWDSKIPHNFFLSIFFLLFCLIFNWKIIALQCCVHLYRATTWISSKYTYYLAALVARLVKNPPAMQKTLVPLLDPKVPWRRTWQPTPIFLPGESPWTEESGELQSMRSQRVGHNSRTKHSTYTVTLPLEAPSHHPPHPTPLSCYRETGWAP